MQKSINPITHTILILLLGLWLYPNTASADEVRLIKRGSVYYAPVRINQTLRTHFIIDSGAGLVYISEPLFQKLRASGSIQRSDMLGEGYSRIADGTLVKIRLFNIKELQIGNTVLHNVKGAVGGKNASILLGQSALKQLEPWHIDTKHHILTFGKKTTLHKGGYISPSNKLNRGEILTFINNYIALHNHGIPQRIAVLYAPNVDYLHYGTIPKEKVLDLKTAFMDRWQQIHFSLLRLVDIKYNTAHPNRATVTLNLAYTLHSDITQQNERGQLQLILGIEKRDRSIRIVSQKQKYLSKHSY